MRPPLLILFFFFSLQSIACTCIHEKFTINAQDLEFKNSTDVIIVKVIEINTENYTVTAVTEEIFKGNFINSDTIVFVNNRYCMPNIDILGNWLLYGRITNGMFEINSCGLSRSFEHPEQNSYFKPLFPPPPPLSKRRALQKRKKKKLEKRFKKNEIKARKNAIPILEKEIIALRKRKE